MHSNISQLLLLRSALQDEKKHSDLQAGMIKTFRAAYGLSDKNNNASRAAANKAKKKAQADIAQVEQERDAKSTEVVFWKTRCKREVAGS